jgi:hypothetical protein
MEGELSVEEGVGEGDAGWYINFVVRVLEGIGKGKYKVLCVFIDSIFCFLPLIVIEYLVSAGLPHFPALPAPDIGFHASLEEWIVFFEAKEVKFDCAFLFVAHAEVEPLPVALGVGVYAHV